MRKIIAILGASLLSLPGLAYAQSNTDLQAQAQALLQQVAQLQAQLAAQQGGTAANSGSATNLNLNPSGSLSLGGSASAGGSCPQIGKILKRGSTGADVTRLQQFLALDPSVYPEGTVSGYYGALTEKAVQRWQAKYNLVSSGSPGTTGWGQVGPRTAAAIALLCATGASSPVGGFIQVSPISGNAPMTVTVVATVNSTNSCAGAIYQLNWGDGSNPVSIPVSANTCTQLSQTYTHLYTNGGTFQVTLSAGAHQTGATVSVYGSTTNTNTQTNNGTQGTGETFSATPTSGATPLTVTFSGLVNGKDAGWCSTGCSDILVFGDGQQGAVPLPIAQTGSQSYSLQHTYTNAGTYTATVYQGQAGTGRPTVGVVTINAGGSGGSTSSTYNPPALTPNYGGNARAVSLTFDNGAGCPAYTLTWGDGANDNFAGGGTCASITKNHTYASNGNYTITLVRGSQSNTVGVNINN